jgi:hypothetical protein
MPTVTVTDYEYENDLLPMVCAKCGYPAEMRVSRPIRFIGDGGGLAAAGVVFGLLFFPPLFLLIAYRSAEVIRVRVPMCETHKDDWKWRDRATFWLLIPAWTISVLVLDAFGVMYLVVGWDEEGIFCFLAAIGVLVIAVFLENVVVLYGAVRLAKPDKKPDVRLSAVHPEFLASLAEDRARDRVDNPERRVPSSDMRQDYDDELA